MEEFKLNMLNNYINNYKNSQELFIGDSYFELLNYDTFTENTFYNIFQNSYNFGIGGTTLFDWLELIKYIPSSSDVKNVYVNLGINDINGSVEYKIEDLQENAFNLFKAIKEKFTNTNITFLTVCHSPLGRDNRNLEIEFNDFLKYSFKNVIDVSKKIKTNLFLEDKLHLNKEGYKIFIDSIKKTN